MILNEQFSKNLKFIIVHEEKCSKKVMYVLRLVYKTGIWHGGYFNDVHSKEFEMLKSEMGGKREIPLLFICDLRPLVCFFVFILSYDGRLKFPSETHPVCYFVF